MTMVIINKELILYNEHKLLYIVKIKKRYYK